MTPKHHITLITFFLALSFNPIITYPVSSINAPALSLTKRMPSGGSALALRVYKRSLSTAEIHLDLGTDMKSATQAASETEGTNATNPLNLASLDSEKGSFLANGQLPGSPHNPATNSNVQRKTLRLKRNLIRGKIGQEPKALKLQRRKLSSKTARAVITSAVEPLNMAGEEGRISYLATGIKSIQDSKVPQESSALTSSSSAFHNRQFLNQDSSFPKSLQITFSNGLSWASRLSSKNSVQKVLAKLLAYRPTFI